MFDFWPNELEWDKYSRVLHLDVMSGSKGAPSGREAFLGWTVILDEYWCPGERGCKENSAL